MRDLVPAPHQLGADAAVEVGLAELQRREEEPHGRTRLATPPAAEVPRGTPLGFHRFSRPAAPTGSTRAPPLPPHPCRAVPQLRVDAAPAGGARARGARRLGLAERTRPPPRRARRRAPEPDRGAHACAAPTTAGRRSAARRARGAATTCAISIRATPTRRSCAPARAARCRRGSRAIVRPSRDPARVDRRLRRIERALPLDPAVLAFVRGARARRARWSARCSARRAARGAARRPRAGHPDLPHRGQLGQPDEQGPDPRAAGHGGGVERGPAARGGRAARRARGARRRHGRAELRRVVRALRRRAAAGVRPRLGLRADRPYLLYLGSSSFIAPNEAASPRSGCARCAQRGPGAARRRRALPPAPAERAPVGAARPHGRPAGGDPPAARRRAAADGPRGLVARGLLRLDAPRRGRDRRQHDGDDRERGARPRRLHRARARSSARRRGHAALRAPALGRRRAAARGAAPRRARRRSSTARWSRAARADERSRRFVAAFVRPHGLDAAGDAARASTRSPTRRGRAARAARRRRAARAGAGAARGDRASPRRAARRARAGASASGGAASASCAAACATILPGRA